MQLPNLASLAKIKSGKGNGSKLALSTLAHLKKHYKKMQMPVKAKAHRHRI